MSSHPPTLPQTVRLTTWNIGYAGLGASSDFVADGGKSWLPPSRQAVRDNLAGILEAVGALRSDVFLFQEVSDGGPMSLWVPVRRRLAALLANTKLLFQQEVGTRGLPWPLRINHAMMISARAEPADVEIVPLPAEPGDPRLLKRTFSLQVARFAIPARPGQWVIANLHLSAFDKGGMVRQAQFDALMAFATAEYAKGNHVVLGGDWNLVLADPACPSTTEERFLFWIVDFPRDKLPAGWTVAADATRPTVRTVHKAYVAGENYVTAIDGFVVSPNVAVEMVTTKDTGFAHTDHMPVSAVLRAL